MEFCKKNPRKIKKTGDLYNFFTDVDDFPAKSGQTDRETESSRPPEIRRPAAFGERKKKMKREGFLLVPPWRMALVYPRKLKTILKNFEQFVKMFLSGGFQIPCLYSHL
ncbi:MAG: hypothetical protein V8R40_12895 [Dysosmobacter sp.]